jgi:DNA-binding transcriptional ArsR family regulator
MSPSRSHVVRHEQEVRALASPIRQEIISAMGALQPCTIAELGEHLGRLPVSLYYHVHKLEEVGLISQVQSPPKSSGGQAQYQVRSHCIRLEPDRTQDANRAALRKVGTAILRHAIRLNDAAVDEKLAREKLKRRHLLSQRTLRLDGPGLQRLNAKLLELHDLLDQLEQPMSEEFFTLTVHLAPNPSRGG